MEKSLYERIGGAVAIKATVVKLYDKILSDDLLAPFFENVQMETLRRSQIGFITMAFGGNHQYTGGQLRQAHQPLVAKGLTDMHFNAVAGHLAASMKELGVSDDLIAEAMAIVSTTRSDVLNKPAT
jgi:hemoglobin